MISVVLTQDPQTKDALRAFLAPSSALQAGVDLCLPEFGGTTLSPLRLLNADPGASFGYPSGAFASRDVKSAMYVHSLLADQFAEDAIRVQSPREFATEEIAVDPPRIGILFGSRSNEALTRVSQRAGLGKLVTFEFTNTWSIVGSDLKRYSLQDPSQLDRASYEQQTDYAVVARVQYEQNRALFIIAGLGARATQGAGRYLSQHWQDLHKEFAAQDFAVILSFAPPIDPDLCQVTARYKDSKRPI